MTERLGSPRRKLSGVLVCVGCADQLAVTLPRNAPLFDELVIVTAEQDVDTRRLVAAWERGEGAMGGAACSMKCVVALGVPLEDAFNKGAYLNAGLAALSDPDWTLFTDADIVLNPALRACVLSGPLDPDKLYFTERAESASPGAINREPNGYFQLWHPTARALLHLRQPGGRRVAVSENFCSAGSIDTWFMHQWAPSDMVFVPELRVGHLDHGAFSGRWNGTVSPRGPKWRQVGFIDIAGFHPMGAPIPEAVSSSTLPLRLTDTKYAMRHETVLCNGALPLDDVLQISPQGLRFRGHDIGNCHVHVALKL